MSEWKQYRRTNIAEMRPYMPGEDLNEVSVSSVDDPPNDHGMIARNPENHKDQWYVARAYFEANFAPQDAAPRAAPIHHEVVPGRGWVPPGDPEHPDTPQPEPTDDGKADERDPTEMLITDNRKLKLAGGELAEAAARVVRDYDGLHRLSLAVAGWHKALADEGGRS